MRTLYILRHGIAFDRGAPDYPDDSERPLTPEGEKKIRQIAHALKKLKVECDLVLTSPFARAFRTAEIVVQVLKAEKKLRECPGLAVGGNPQAVVRVLNERHQAAQSVMLVGHEPFLSQLVSVLLVGDRGLALDLKKGGLCKLAVNRLRYGRCATLEWLLTPRVMMGK
jgi:phosphohistidine phosphatase